MAGCAETLPLLCPTVDVFALVAPLCGGFRRPLLYPLSYGGWHVRADPLEHG
jgi:hypothetical protein